MEPISEASLMSETGIHKPYSLLMTLYVNDRVDWFREAVLSMESQSVPPSEYMFVVDGPIPDRLGLELDGIRERLGNKARIHFIDENGGRGPALAIGVELCSYEYITILDSDDLALPSRAIRALRILSHRPDVDIVGTLVHEFTADPKTPHAVVNMPEEPDEIAQFAKRRCPMRQSSVMLRRSSVLECGNYRAIHLAEDYDLFVRMLANGRKFWNIQYPLTSVRVSEDFFRRRGGLRYAKSIAAMRRSFLRLGFLSKSEFLKYSIGHVLITLMPNWVRRASYSILLRDPVTSGRNPE